MTSVYGRIVRRARMERGLTQVELSRNSGIGQSNISAIENERRVPSAETLHRLLFACGYELVAVAGEQVLALPPPDDIGLLDGALVGDSMIAKQPRRSPVSMATRVRLVTAVLDASEAIVRAR